MPGSPLTRHNSLQSYPSYIPIEELGAFDPRYLFSTDSFAAELVRILTTSAPYTACTSAVDARNIIQSIRGSILQENVKYMCG